RRRPVVEYEESTRLELARETKRHLAGGGADLEELPGLEPDAAASQPVEDRRAVVTLAVLEHQAAAVRDHVPLGQAPVGTHAKGAHGERVDELVRDDETAHSRGGLEIRGH